MVHPHSATLLTGQHAAPWFQSLYGISVWYARYAPSLAWTDRQTARTVGQIGRRTDRYIGRQRDR